MFRKSKNINNKIEKNISYLCNKNKLTFNMNENIDWCIFTVFLVFSLGYVKYILPKGFDYLVHRDFDFSSMIVLMSNFFVIMFIILIGFALFHVLKMKLKFRRLFSH